MIGFLETRELFENYKHCRLYTRRHAKSFYFSSHLLPKDKQRAAYAVYAFCRYADEIADNAAAISDTARARRRLDDLRNQLHYVYTHSQLMSPKLLAFRDSVLRYGIPEDYFLDLLRGVEMDLTKTRFATFHELREYCYCVASVVGLIMTRIFGVSDDRAWKHAEDLGTAMQLTNILRDIGEDAERGRIYIPEEEMEHFGYSVDDVHGRVVNDAFKRLMRFQIERARRYYEHAAVGIPMLTNDGSRFCVKVMSRTYAQILVRIEQNNYDVYTRRACVSLSRKILLALGRSEASVAVNTEPGERILVSIPAEHHRAI